MPDTPAQQQQENFSSVGDQAQGIDSSINDTGASDAQGHPVQEVESLCMNCHKNGTTRMLLTKIPFFREIIIMSFECPHCGLKNSEIQPAAQIAEKGSRYIFKIENKEDFNRQIVKSETATCMFTELELEIPPERGQLTNIEGLLLEMVLNLSADQPARKEAQPEVYEKLAAFIERVQACLNGDAGCLPLTFYVDDPAGNSWVEFTPGQPSHKWSMYEYNRTAEQNVFLGLISADDVAQHRKLESEQKKAATSTNVSSTLNNDNPKSSGFTVHDHNDIENLSSEVQTFHATCSSCFEPCETNMKSVDIPHFKEVIIMSTFCEHCGYKSNEVKTGGAIPDKGRKISLKITDPDDLARDILKSETCGLKIPELNLDLTPGTLGGRFTTIEGLLSQVYDELHSRVFTQTSDSMEEETKQRWTSFFAKLQDASEGKIGFTVVMEDPLAASYVQNVYAPDNDPNMTIEEYDRTEEQNEDLGLNDMKTD
ncbi:zinc-finger protein ZPR1 [Metschnikowia bicuspidata var. bicuspidata NRRL YB-4993]|uniref:Zinc-finger protein ZPR1 n=1 Tax=Metschnikowia bicuspidata var. bicuspidata NRRL YB-4993 TaxID=869754 RepID=A0A1A0H6H4_9ASCO|nr:zinc-finger protein ZPR1 [Metschnikowia bicuspidata var. bicuspidata NRRL YB-4993]OBA19684.1 zinc-finger protein ZPR1 [Metschnikowia bicuspidata var. bicuspidata NRRL YB-4993]